MLPVGTLSRLVQAGQEFAGATRTGIATGLRATGNLLFPTACVFCGESLDLVPPDCALLCATCVGRLAPTQQAACRRCASPLPLLWGAPESCPRCQKRRYHFQRALALGEYQTYLRQAVIWMKRHPHEPLTRAMGILMAERLSTELLTWQPDVIIPVPMHWWRRLSRGTNTTRLLAGQVARKLAIPMSARTLLCRRKSRKQGTLRPDERFRNMRGAFRISSGYDITEKRVLLIDDILTTGATASEAARMLRRAGAAKIAVAVVARGVGLS